MNTYLSVLLLVASLADPVGPELKPKAAPNLRQVQPEMGDLSGYYICKGQETSGKGYSGIVILNKKNDVYLISWVLGNGSSFTGIAIRQGNTMAGSWSIPTEKGIVKGINLYRVESGSTGPRLDGHWTSLPGSGAQQPETLTFLKKLEAEEE